MNKYISVNISNKDCKGIYLFADTNLKIITSDKEAKSLISGAEFKMQLQIRADGQRGKKIFTFKTKDKTFLKALEYIASKRDELRTTLKEQGTLIEVKKKNTDDEVFLKKETFIDRVEHFMNTKAISLRDSTIQNYSTALYNHSKPLHNKSINDITLDDVQRIINNLVGKRADATIVLYARTLGAFLKNQKANISKEWDGLSLPEVNNKVDYSLNLEDTKRIIKAMRGYSGTMIDDKVFYTFEEIRNIFIFLLTGRRINEVLNLKYTDINFETSIFKIPATTAKGKKELIFNIDGYLMEAIESQARLSNINLTQLLPNKRLFKYTKETPRVHFQNLLQALGLPRLRLHDIRHMLASTLVQNKVPIADISVMLGHSSIAITESRYASKSKDQATRATDAFYNIIENE